MAAVRLAVALLVGRALASEVKRVTFYNAYALGAGPSCFQFGTPAQVEYLSADSLPYAVGPLAFGESATARERLPGEGFLVFVSSEATCPPAPPANGSFYENKMWAIQSDLGEGDDHLIGWAATVANFYNTSLAWNEQIYDPEARGPNLAQNSAPQRAVLVNAGAAAAFQTCTFTFLDPEGRSTAFSVGAQDFREVDLPCAGSFREVSVACVKKNDTGNATAVATAPRGTLSDLCGSKTVQHFVVSEGNSDATALLRVHRTPAACATGSCSSKKKKSNRLSQASVIVIVAAVLLVAIAAGGVLLARARGTKEAHDTTHHEKKADVIELG